MDEQDIKNIESIIKNYETQGAILKLAILTDVKHFDFEAVQKDIVNIIDFYGENYEEIGAVLFKENLITLISKNNGTSFGYYFSKSYDIKTKNHLFEHIKKDCIVRGIEIS